MHKTAFLILLLSALGMSGCRPMGLLHKGRRPAGADSDTTAHSNTRAHDEDGGSAADEHDGARDRGADSHDDDGGSHAGSRGSAHARRLATGCGQSAARLRHLGIR
jgi:hypothetical protein